MSDKRGAKVSEQLPISAHPAFPAIVALWFAALLGLGSLVLPVALLEGLAQLTGLASTVGVTARIAIALAAGLAGAALGLAIARKVVAANSTEPVTRRAATLRHAQDHAPALSKRPISAHEEFGEGGLDAETPEPVRAPIPGRRRALSVTEEGARSDFLELAPLPGKGEGEPLDLVAYAEAEDEPQAELAPEAQVEPAVLEGVGPAAAPAVPFGTAGLSTPRRFDHHLETAMPASMPLSMPFGQPAESQLETPLSQAKPATPTVSVADRALGELGVVELVERFALALERRQAQAEPAGAEIEPAPLVFPPATNFAPPASEPAPENDAVRAMPAALRPIQFDADEPDDEADEGDALAGFDFSSAMRSAPRPFAAPFAPLAMTEPDQDEEDTAEDSYPSLLTMRSPFGQPRESVRIEDEADPDDEIEPVVIFPGHGTRQAAPAVDGPARDASAPFAAPAGLRAFDQPSTAPFAPPSEAARPFAATRALDPADTERALRDALEKLQRLSGAA